jgi:hypothetical protein
MTKRDRMTPLQQLVALARSQDMFWREDQEALTASLLVPAMPALLDLLGVLRRETDAVVAAMTPQPAGYPIGFCAVIRDRVFDGLMREPLIRQLTDRGLALGKVFVILKDRYFQNAIQFGNLYIDVANDSVDPAKPWLEWMDVREVPFANVGDLATVARVAGEYHRCRVHPNTFFPLLAPVVPLLAVHDDGRLGLLHFQDGGFLKDLAAGFPHLRQWLAGPARDLAPLPEAHAEALRAACGRNDRDVFAFEHRPCSLADVALQADAYSAAFADPARHATIQAVFDRVPEATRRLRGLTIRNCW